MYRTTTPDSSPLSSKGPTTSFLRALYSLEQNSSLKNPSDLNLDAQTQPNNVRDIRKRQYKSQTSSRTLSCGRFDDSPIGQQLLLRDPHFKARCLEQVRRQKRGKAVQKTRSSDHLFSSDGFDTENDHEMDVDGDAGDENALFQDELYRRVVLNEIRKAKHAMNVSFELEVGSSIDPSMYEDMNTLEEGLTGKQINTTEEESPLSDIEYDDALIAEYLAELEESELQAVQGRVTCGMVDINTEDPSDLERLFASEMNPEQESPSRSVYSEFIPSSAPTSPAFHALDIDNNTEIFTCSFCHSHTRLYDQIACLSCISTRSLQYAQEVWANPDMHSTSFDRSHTPLVAETPMGSGVGAMMLCSSDGCDWSMVCHELRCVDIVGGKSLGSAWLHLLRLSLHRDTDIAHPFNRQRIDSRGFECNVHMLVESCHKSTDKANVAIVDAGASLLLVSEEIMKKIYSMIPGAMLIVNANLVGWVYPVTSKVPGVAFTVRDKTYAVNASNIAYANYNSDMLYGGMRSGGHKDHDVLVMFSSRTYKYVVFDQEKAMLGVTQKKREMCKGYRYSYGVP